jgi:hypothetical protein
MRSIPGFYGIGDRAYAARYLKSCVAWTYLLDYFSSTEFGG